MRIDRSRWLLICVCDDPGNRQNTAAARLIAARRPSSAARQHPCMHLHSPPWRRRPYTVLFVNIPAEQNYRRLLKQFLSEHGFMPSQCQQVHDWWKYRQPLLTRRTSTQKNLILPLHTGWRKKLSHCKYSENFTTELRGNWWTSAILYAEHSH